MKVFRITLLALLLAGCKTDQPQSKLPTVSMQIGSGRFTLEVADTDSTRRFGLMRRDALPGDHGMLFVFPEQEHLSFYMRNTRIPLDILYLDSAGKIVSIKQMVPFDETSIPSDAPAQYAIELNRGTVKSIGVQPGMVLQLPPGLKARD